jgi:hypothetical protein
MESGSSAKSLLSLFSSSKLTTFTTPTSRNFYKTTPPPNASSDDPSPSQDIHPPRKKRRRRRHRSNEWTGTEIRSLEMYRNLRKGEDDVDDGLRSVLLPNRSAKEVKLQIIRIDETIREKRRGSKLLELQEEENERFVVEEKERVIDMEKDYKRRRRGMDDILGLTAGSTDLAQEGAEDKIVKGSLDQGLGLIEETVEQRRKRELDEALGLLK